MVYNLLMRDKHGRFMKGDNGMLGKHHSLETREKLRKAHLGMKISEETRRKMSIANKKPNSGQFKKGISSWKKGTGKPLEGNKVCPVCNKEFHYKRASYNKPQKTCSKECRYTAAKIAQKGIERPHAQGENSYLWRGGVTTLYNKIRGCLKYDLYREACFKRDNYTCQFCNKRGSQNLHADHIISFAQIIDFYKITTFEKALKCKLLWDLRNIRTLCEDCHEKTPTYMIPLSKHPKLL